MARQRPVSTYSIVARDPETGDLGVAVQSHWFSVGTVVTWAESEVGAVATQALAEPGYGPKGLQLMRQDLGAEQALQRLVSEDEESALRQVAFVDASGGVATHTGARCIAEAGHVQGDGFTVQANMMARSTVWDAMADAYRAADGDLADRMMAALYAAEEEGGDIRGRQSAALLVVRGESTDKPWEDRVFDVRVEDHPQPLDELARLVGLRRAYIAMTEGDDAIGAGRLDLALEKYSKAAKLAPENPEMSFWNAVSLTGVNRTEEALPLFREVFAADDSWRELVSRLVDVGLLEADQATIERIKNL